MASALILASAGLAGIRAETAYAVEGWTKSEGEWRYLDRDDVPVQNTWRKSKDSWFYLGSDGTMKRSCFIELGSGLFYVDEAGKRAEQEWVFIETADNQGHEAGWYYFGSNGKAYRRTSSSSFKKTIDGKTYIFDENGRMGTGWFNEDGYPLEEGMNPLEEGEYFAAEDGALKKNYWLDYESLGLEGLEDLTSVYSGRDYREYNQVWLYFNDRHKKVKSNGIRLKQMEIDGGTYGFDEYGIMIPWWTKVASVSNADKGTPVSDGSAKFFAGYDGGKLLKDSWFWMYPSENLLEHDFDDGEYSWWRTDHKGEVYRNRIRKVKDRYYAFDGLGRMQTGFVLFDNRDNFVAQYDPNAWSSQAFKDGDIHGIEKADLYLFSPDELNDGSMQTGYDLKVELEDGVFTFGFRSNGIACGNRNKLERMRDSFYINGLRLEADRDFGYQRGGFLPCGQYKRKDRVREEPRSQRPGRRMAVDDQWKVCCKSGR